MSKKGVLLVGVLILAVGAGIFFTIDTQTPAKLKPVTSKLHPTTATSSSSQITYTADGKIDTSDWQEYRSEYGGFSVRAPKKMSMLGCLGHACDPNVDGQHFYYVLFKTSINDEVGEIGLSIDVIKKDKGSTLDTWLSDYIVSGRDQFFAVQKVSVNGYSALQFDWQKKASEQGLVYMRSSIYQNGESYTSVLIDPTAVTSRNPSSRFLVIDLGDRYAFVSHSLSIDKEALSKYYIDIGYPIYSKQALAIPSNKTLTDIYAAILDSFKAFTPTKP